MEHYPQVYAEIKEAVVTKRPIYTMARCLDAVCKYYDVTKEEVKGRSREAHLITPRHHFCWVVYRNRIDISYPMIGRFLGRDHTTIVHAVAKFNEYKCGMYRPRVERDVQNVDRLIHDMFTKS